jgi:hypothetical protein
MILFNNFLQSTNIPGELWPHGLEAMDTHSRGNMGRYSGRMGSYDGATFPNLPYPAEIIRLENLIRDTPAFVSFTLMGHLNV